MARYTLEGDLSEPGPGCWQSVGKVSKLFIYPVKSCKGVEVGTFTAGQHAAENGDLVDRQLMVVDNKKKLVTARKFPNMVLIEVSVKDDVLTLTYPGMECVQVNIAVKDDMENGYDVFGELCQGVDLGDEVGVWLSDVILNDEDGGLRLICHPKMSSSRPNKTANIVSPNMRPEDRPYFADTFAYMMLSKASIEGLNKLLNEENVDMEVEETRFRPNILIEGDFPEFSEDKWPSLKIGDVIFRNVRVCDRCVFTSVDPFMGDKHPQQEPLKTLRKYRSAVEEDEKKIWGSSPFFGVFLAADNKGSIKTGDSIFISQDI